MTSIPTERLLLEPLNRIHADEMFPVLSDPAIYDWLDHGAPSSVEALQTRYARLEAGHSPDGSEVWLNFLVRLNGGQAIGDVQATVYPGQKTYVGYVLASAYWGKGYAAEAMTALLAHLAQEHPTPVTLAVIEVENTRSAALLRRLNFSAAPDGHSSANGLTATERLYVRYPEDATARRDGTSVVGYPDLSKRIQQLPRSSLSRQAPKRMSVAGAQHKLLVVVKGVDLYEPVGATPSTHILKPDHPNAQTYPASAFLEQLTMRMAAAAGLSVPQVGLLQVPEPVYVIERFDRKMDAQLMRPESGAQAPAVQRLHIIDACQLLNKSRLFKHSGATVEALREAIQRTGDTLALPQRVFRWLVFNLLVANDDCHLKNLSFIVQANTITLAPHYDLLATGVYHTGSFAGADGRWPDVEMTIPLVGPVTRFGGVTPEAVLAAAATLGVPPAVAVRVAREVVTRTFRYFDRIYAEHYPAEPGLLTTQQALPGEVEALDTVDAQPEPAVQGDGSPAARHLGLHRRILRVLRYIILPEMGRRISAPAREQAA